MVVTKETLDYLSKLAHIEISEDEAGALINDLNRILTFMEELNEVDTTNTEPLIFVNEEESTLREDNVISVISQDEALSNAPQRNEAYFLVPKVIS